MRTVLGLLLALAGLAGPGQDAKAPSFEEISRRMQAAAPAAEAFDLTYLGSLGLEEELRIDAETRVRMIPGRALRVDASTLGFTSNERQFQELDLDVTIAEIGSDSWFRAGLSRAPAMVYSLFPPVVAYRSGKGLRPSWPELFPADLPFRFLIDSPALQTALSPAWRLSMGPVPTVEGPLREGERSYFILRSDLDLRTAPVDPESVIAAIPFDPLQRLVRVDAATMRVDRITLRISVDGETVEVNHAVVEWKELAPGVTVPSRLLCTIHPGGDSDEAIVFDRRLVRAGTAKLSEDDVWPAALRDDVHVRIGGEKAEGDPAAGLARHLGRYRDRFVKALREQRDPEPLDPAAPLPELERMLEERPGSPVLTRLLLHALEAANRGDRLVPLAKEVAARTWPDPQLPLAAARVLLQAGDAVLAAKALDGIDPGLSIKVAARKAALTCTLHQVRKDDDGAAAALADALAAATPEVRMALVDALAPIPHPRFERFDGFDASALAGMSGRAISKRPEVEGLHLLRLRASWAARDADFPKHLAEAAAAPADATLLEAIVAVAQRRGGDEPELKGALLQLAGRAASSAEAALLAGDALLRAGEPDAARSQFQESLRRLRAVPGGPAPQRIPTVIRLGTALSRAQCGAELREAAELYIGFINTVPRLHRYLRSAGRDPDPVGLVCIQMAAERKYEDLVRLLSAVDPAKISQVRGLNEVVRTGSDFLETARRLAEAGRDPAAFRRLAGYHRFKQWNSPEVLEVLEAGRKAAPEDLDLLFDLAQAYRSFGQQDPRAREVDEALLAILEARKISSHPRINRVALLSGLASSYLQAGDKEKAVAALDRIGSEPSSTLRIDVWMVTIAETYEQAGREDKAIECYRLALGRPGRPGRAHNVARAGRALGKLMEKRKEYEEAYRCYRLGAKAGRDQLRGRPARAPDPCEAALDAMMKTLGRDFFVRRWIEKPLDPLSADEEARVKRWYANLASDSLVERDMAAAEITAFGPRAARVLRAGLDSPDATLRETVLSILIPWAEPK